MNVKQLQLFDINKVLSVACLTQKFTQLISNL